MYRNNRIFTSISIEDLEFGRLHIVIAGVYIRKIVIMQDYEDNVIVYPPNKVLERNIHYSQIPTIHKSLMFLDFNSKSNRIHNT